MADDDRLEWRDSPEVVALSDALKRVKRLGVGVTRRLDGGVSVFIDPPAGADEPRRVAAMSEIVELALAAREDLETLMRAESIPLPFWVRHYCGTWIQMRAGTLADARRTPVVRCGRCRVWFSPGWEAARWR